MEREKMKHAAPLTPFQEKLYDIVLQANKKETNVKEISPIELTVIEETPEEALSERFKFNPEYDTAESGWKEKTEHVIECLVGIIEDHITGLFLTIMTVNMLWLQILSVWVIPARKEGMQNMISFLKYLFLMIIVIYILKRFIQRGKGVWRRFKIWVETPKVKGKHIRQ